jgi:alpha-beta hydrolase superfamily lysophospholipase
MTFNDYRFRVYRSCRPDDELILVIVHGMMEHGKRYFELAKFLQDNKISTYILDLPGHGETGDLNKDFGHMDDDGWKHAIGCINEVVMSVSDSEKNIFLFGHSMGSFLAMQIGSTNPFIKGLVLSGMTYPSYVSLRAGRMLTDMLKLVSPRLSGWVFHKLTFFLCENSFKSDGSPFAWLSSDKTKVDDYSSDKYCGKLCTVGFYNQLFKGVQSVINLVPDMNVHTYVLSSLNDPMGGYGRGPKKWAKCIAKKWGWPLNFVEYKGRHELINEIDRKNVYNDILNWIKRSRRT